MVTRSGYVSRIPQRILNDSSLSDKSYHLFLAMLHAIDPETNELQMSMPELQAISRMSESTVRRHLRDLVERGYLLMQRPAQGQHTPTVYRLPESLLQDSLVEIASAPPQRQVSERNESDDSGSAPAQSSTRAQRNMLTRIRLIRNRGGKRQVSGFAQDPELTPDPEARQVSARYACARARMCLKALKAVDVFRYLNINIYKTVSNTNANTGLDSRVRAREASRAVTPATDAAPAVQAAPVAAAPVSNPPAVQAAAAAANPIPPHLRVPGLAPEIMQALLVEYGELRIAIVVREMYRQSTVIRNPAGWFLTALRKQWDFNTSIKPQRHGSTAYADPVPAPVYPSSEGGEPLAPEDDPNSEVWKQNVEAASMMGRFWRGFDTGFDTEAFMRKYRPDLVDLMPEQDGQKYVTGKYAHIIEH